MNNEPVAWMVDGVLFTSLGAALNISFDIEQPCIPLYTHPVTEHFEDEPQAEELHEIMQSNAELTDEEIAVIGDKCFGTMSYELWLQTNEFARAILRKAQDRCNGFCGEYECKENQSNCKRKAQEQ